MKILSTVILSTILLTSLVVTGIPTASATTEVISIHSGDGPFFGPDSSVTMLIGPTDAGFGVPLTPADFAAASAGSAAIVIPHHTAWIPSLPSNPDAHWISTHPIDPNANPSIGLVLSTALYAIDFEVTSASIDSASLDIYWASDNLLGDSANEGVFINGIPLAGTAGSGFSSEHASLGHDITSIVTPGINTLYVLGTDVGGPSGVIFNASITVESTPEPEDGKVTICHKPGTPAEKTLEVPEAALKGHLKHGDTLGPC